MGKGTILTEGTIEHYYNLKDLEMASMIANPNQPCRLDVLTPKQKIQLWLKPLNGLKSCMEKNLVHLDIKGKNMLLEENNGVFSMVIGDWGGAFELSNLHKLYPSFVNMLGIHTAKFVSHCHILEGQEAYAERDLEAVEEILHKIDIFGAAIAMFTSLARRSPVVSYIKNDRNNREYIEEVDFRLVKFLPSKMYVLLTEMGSTNYRTQPTKIEVCARLEEILQEWQD